MSPLPTLQAGANPGCAASVEPSRVWARRARRWARWGSCTLLLAYVGAYALNGEAGGLVVPLLWILVWPGFVICCFAVILSFFTLFRLVSHSHEWAAYRDAIGGISLSGGVLLLLLASVTVDSEARGGDATLLILVCALCGVLAVITLAGTALRFMYLALRYRSTFASTSVLKHLSAAAGTSLIYLCVLGVILLLGASLHTSGTTESPYNPARSIRNLECIGQEAMRYRMSGRHYPRSLQLFVAEAEELGQDKLIATGSARDRMKRPGSCDYGSVLDCAPFLVHPSELPADLMFAWEKRPFYVPADGGRAVLLADGTVCRVPRERFRRLRARLETWISLHKGK